MTKKSILLGLIVSTLVSGCAGAKFAVIGENEYHLSKLSDACAIGSPSSLLTHLRGEAEKFCAGRNEIPVETESDTTMGIPAIRCTSAELTFSCKPYPTNTNGKDDKAS